MNYYALIPLAAFITNFFTWIYILAQHQKNPVNHSCLILSGGLCLWSMLNFILWLPMNEGLLEGLIFFNPLVWLPIGFLFLNFTYACVDRKRDGFYYFFFLLVAIAVYLSLFTKLVVDGYQLCQWGPKQNSGVLFFPVVCLVVISPICHALTLLFRKHQKTKDFFLKKLLKNIIIGIGLTIFVAIWSEVIITNILQKIHYPPLAASSSAILSVFISYAVIRHRFLSIGIKDIAGELFANLQDGVIILDQNDQMIQTNLAAQEMLALDRRQIKARKISTFFHPYSSTEVYKNYETRYIRQGEERIISLSQSMIKQSGQEIGKILIIRDITDYQRLVEDLEQHRSHLEERVKDRTEELFKSNQLLTEEIKEREKKELELRRQEEFLQAAAEAKTHLLTVSNYDTALNKALAVIGEAFEMDRIYIIENNSKSGGEIRFEWGKERVAKGNWLTSEITQSFLLSGNPANGVYTQEFSSTGEYRELAGVKFLLSLPISIKNDLWSLTCLVDSTRKPQYTNAVIAILTSVAASIGGALNRKQVEEALRESEERYRTLADNAFDLISEVSVDGRFVYMNRKSIELFGYTPKQLLGLKAFSLINPEDRQRLKSEFKDLIATFSVKQGILFYKNRDREQRWLELIGKPYRTCAGDIRVIILARDITEKKKMEEEIFSVRKLESTTLFARGIAHDFNNMLSIIWGKIAIAKCYLHPRSKAFEKLNDTEQVFQRAKDLTKQLLTFAKGGAPRKSIISICDLLKEAMGCIGNDSKIKCAFSAPGQIWGIEGDRGQLIQVFHNLFLNATQSMPRGGKIEVKAQNMIVDEKPSSSLLGGRYVSISITDLGEGIPEEYLPRIFDPYFTTKDGGNGLGLAIVYAIIKRHGGHIFVESKPGEGTVFTILLPTLQVVED